VEYLRATRMPALQCFTLDLEKRMKLGQIFCQVQNILLCIFKKKMFCKECSRLSYFTIICNDDEYKITGQYESLGQLYDVQN
jgi:hypothetical protein